MSHLNEIDRHDITEVGHATLSDCKDGSQNVSHEDFMLSLIPEHATVFVVIQRQIGPPGIRIFKIVRQRVYIRNLAVSMIMVMT